MKLVGSFDPATFTISLSGCLADIGGLTGPNVIVNVTISGGVSVKLYSNQSNANCNAYVPNPSTTPTVLGATIVPANSTRDFDGDGCTDAQELWAGEPGVPANCGDDPWNPYDSGPASGTPNVSGSWDITMEQTRADAGAPGFYYECKSDIQQNVAALTAPILCYVDNPGVTVNPDAVPGFNTTCPPAPATYCGDGLPGAPPPGCTDDPLGNCTNALPPGCTSLPCPASRWLFSPISNQTLDPNKKHTTLMGSYDTANHLIDLQGCFNPQNPHPGPLVDTYLKAKINAYTGIGYGNLFPNQTDANCTGGAPIGAATLVRISAVRQAPGAKGTCTQNPYNYSGCRDSDGDGCPDKYELGNSRLTGGLRDPLNRWDYFNPEKVNTPHSQTIADTLKVQAQFGIHQGSPNYTIDTDRTGIIGGNSWNLGPPDGQQTVADILAANAQFGHNC